MSTLTIKKSDISMLSGSTSKTSGTTYTLGFPSEKVANLIAPLLVKEGLKKIDEKGVFSKKFEKFVIRFNASEAVIIRSAVRKLKNSGLAIYKGETPKYVKTATEPAKKVALSLKKVIAVIVPEKVEKTDSKPKKKAKK